MFNYLGSSDATPRGESFNFAIDLQKLTYESGTPDILMKEFSYLFYKVDKEQWKNKMEKFMSSRSGENFRSRLLWSD